MTEIDGYTDLEVIGQGGFAVVYKAQQVSVGRAVAIKLLIDPSPDDDLIRRFQRESKAVGALSWHPHIAAVVDAGKSDGGRAYIVFELLSGGSLEDRIAADGPMPWPEAVAAMIRIADAVEAAHRADVLHRDIKPANILLDRLGVAKLGDFGIASMQDGSKTETGMLATTVAHAAPELFDGQPSSTATDVYALGSTLHNLVTGTPPFNPLGGERISTTIGKILNEAPPRPDPATVPPQIATVIAHALAKQPQYRPRSAAAFGQALQQAQRELGVAVTAMPVTDKEPHAPHHRPDPAPAAGDVGHPGVVSTESSERSAAPLGGPPSTRHVPFVPPISTVERPRKPFSRTIAALSIVAVLLAAGVGGLALFQAQRTVGALAITQGGAEIRRYSALAETEMPAPFDGIRAIDRDEATYWGIAPDPVSGTGIVGTSYLIDFVDPQTIVRVGISNGDSSDFGRIAEVRWATSKEAFADGDPGVVVQELDDRPGAQVVPFRATTDRLVLAIFGVHDDDAPNAGIAEILIEVE